MDAPFSIEVRDGQVVTSLRKLPRELDPAPAMKIVSLLAQRAVRDNFRAQRDPKGVPWAPLSGATIQRRRNQNKSSIKILIDTGRLMNSITAESDQTTARVGTNVFYAPFHNFGTRRMPQREFMGITDADQARIVDRLNDFVLRKLREGGLR